jgi:SpoVK/Ycf46/Vps4 family AAA+-type ATPase
MLGKIQSEAANLARHFNHDRVTDIHVLLAWLSLDSEASPENSEVIRLNLRESLKTLLKRGLVNTSTGSELALTEKAREYLKIIKDNIGNAEVLQGLLNRSNVEQIEIETAEQIEETENANPLIAERKPTLEEALAQLDSLIGLEDVKKRVKELVATQRVQQHLRQIGQPTISASLNLVFSGDPGTGKTTVARIISDIYCALGLVSRGHLVEVGPQDLVADFVGQTASKTSDVIERATGGVLFIDEAYSLVEPGTGGYGAEAIATLVKAMEDKRDQFAVIVAGYTEPMMRFIKSNPGLQSRFTNQIYFENYQADELLAIFNKMCSDHKITASPETLTLVRRHLNRNDTGGSGGNGRYIRKLFAKMFENMSVRAFEDEIIEDHEVTAFQPEDVPMSLETHAKPVALEDALKELEDLVGLDDVKTRVRELIQVHQARQAMDNANRPVVDNSLNMVFTGDPGTGKTTVARIVTKIYQAVGVLPRGHLIETGRQDLIASYVGQTAQKVEGKVDESMGGVLFIDEAYSLTNNGGGVGYGDEAVATLVQLLDNRRGKFALICAGYKEDMRLFLESNPGLKSRIDHEIFFPNYTLSQLLEIFEKIAGKKEISVTDAVREAVKTHLNKNRTGGDNGNGRYVRKLFERMYANMAARAASEDFRVELLSKFEPTDVPERIYDERVQGQIGFS